jgi:hypothetical protein
MFLALSPLLSPGTARAACPDRVSVAALEAHLGAAERAYTDLDGAGLAAALDQLGLDLPCLGEVVPSPVAARYHRDLALLAWAEGREADARAELAALARLEPGITLPPELVPAGHGLHDALAAARPATPTPVPPPRDGELWFDGVAAASRPGEPTIAQLLQGGRPAFTERLAVGEPLPAYDVAAPPPAPTAARRHLGLAAAAAGAGVAAYAGAWVARALFDGYEPGPGTDGEDAYRALTARRTAAGVFTVGAGVGVAAGATLAVVRW